VFAPLLLELAVYMHKQVQEWCVSVMQEPSVVHRVAGELRCRSVGACCVMARLHVAFWLVQSGLSRPVHWRRRPASVVQVWPSNAAGVRRYCVPRTDAAVLPGCSFVLVCCCAHVSGVDSGSSDLLCSFTLLRG
jgi:hypothetical protein